MKVRRARIDDVDEITSIYNYYITNSHATFEIEPVNTAEMVRRMSECIDDLYPFFVCESELSQLLGYAYGHKFKSREAYRHSIEVSIYVRPDAQGQSIGTNLYKVLLSEIKQLDFHAVIAGISLPNDASIRLHEKFGFVKVAHFHEVGSKFDRWIDVGYWQLLRNID